MMEENVVVGDTSVKLSKDGIHRINAQDQYIGAIPCDCEVLQEAVTLKLSRQEYEALESYRRDKKSNHKSKIAQWMDIIDENIIGQRTKRRSVLFILILIWVAVLCAALLYKSSSEKWLDIFEYFTNLSFLFQAVYYSLCLFICIENPWRRRLEKVLFVGFFFILYSQILLVFLLVIGVLTTAPQLLTNEMEIGGGEYDDGTVLVIERLFHVFPAVLVLIVIIFIKEDIVECSVLLMGYVKVNLNGRHQLPDLELDEPACPTYTDHRHVYVDMKIVWCYVITQYILASLPFLTYMLIVDLEEQYDIPGYLSTWAPVLGVLGFNLFIIGLPILFIGYSSLQKRYVVTEVFQLIVKHTETMKAENYGTFQHPDSEGNIKVYIRDIPGIRVVPL